MSKTPIKVTVSTFETEIDFMVQSKTTGQSMFDMVVQALGIRETWYFGLSYTDTQGHEAWLLWNKKVAKQDIRRESPLKLRFKFKYFPEEVSTDIIQDNTLRLLYIQTKHDIMNQAIYCPAEKAVLLAGYAVQAKFNDYDSNIHNREYLASENLIPAGVIDKHTLTREEWEEKVSEIHKTNRGMSREEAMLDYLKLAQGLEMFGISYFPIMNKRGTEMLLGVDSLGINIYDMNDKLSPKVTFPWSEIKKISHNKDKFKVQIVDKASKPFESKAKDSKSAQKIYDICSGNHEMYVRRRKPDSLEVQQMKKQKAEEEKVRAKEREALKREMKARAEEENRRRIIEEKLSKMEDDMKKRGQDLTEALETIQKLQKQLEETQAYRNELERQQNELREMLERLEAEKDMEASERQRLADEIAAKQAEIHQVKSEAEAKEEEAQRLQDEIERARRQLEETTEAMQRSADLAAHQAAIAAEATRREQELLATRRDSSSSSSSECDESIPKIVVDDVDERQDQILKDLRKDLEEKKDMERETDEDKIYRKNLEEGRDKFKTLREIRRGNTKRRIDSFENM